MNNIHSIMQFSSFNDGPFQSIYTFLNTHIFPCWTRFMMTKESTIFHYIFRQQCKCSAINVTIRTKICLLFPLFSFISFFISFSLVFHWYSRDDLVIIYHRFSPFFGQHFIPTAEYNRMTFFLHSAFSMLYI